jgi:hypothetical protein
MKKREVYYSLSLLNLSCSSAIAFFLFCLIWASNCPGPPSGLYLDPQSTTSIITGTSSMPLSVIRYRNFDAFLGETTLETIPSSTSVLNFSVSTAEEIFSADARSSKNEFLVLDIKSRKINSTYLQTFRNRTGNSNSKSVHQCKLVDKAKEKL